MKLLLKRKEISIRFGLICMAFTMIANIIMTSVLFNDVSATNVNTIETTESTTIPTTVVTIETSPVETTVEATVPVTKYTEPVETTQYTEPMETEPKETEANKTTSVYKYGNRVTPAVDIDIPTGDDMKNYTNEVDTSNYTLLGTYKITGYAPTCTHCCGKSDGITASGVPAISGYTVAATKDIPFGTTLYIEGYGYYVVEDRGGFPKTTIDVACPDHESCYDITGKAKVYIV